MKKKQSDSKIKELMNEIELYNAENNLSKKNWVRFYKDKIKKLGAVEKTYFTPFKHRLLVNEAKKNKKKAIKKTRLESGLLYNQKKSKK